MELRELHYFVQIAKDHSYTLAAEHLYISQPALSKMVKKLEGELDVPLFIINHNGVSLTDYGEMLYTKTVPLLNEFNAIQNFVTDVRGIKSGKLRVGATPMLGSLFLVDIVVDFCKQYPNVELKLTENGSKAIRQQLIDGDIDIGICIVGDKSDYLTDRVLFQDEMVVCLPSSNPLSQYTELEFEQLKNEYFNCYSNASTLYTQITDRCIQAGFEPKINISSSKIGMIIQMTARGKGICILPRPYAAKYSLPGLKLIPIKGSFLWVSCLVKNKTVYQSCVSQLFENFVVEYFKKRYPDSPDESSA